MLFPTFKQKKMEILKSALHLLVNGRWFLQIVDRDSGNLYPVHVYPLFPCSVFISNVGVVWGGGVMLSLHFMQLCYFQLF